MRFCSDDIAKELFRHLSPEARAPYEEQARQDEASLALLPGCALKVKRPRRTDVGFAISGLFEHCKRFLLISPQDRYKSEMEDFKKVKVRAVFSDL